jgi:two-component system NtrC family response regulator/two-component system nitrogen regulation response regulator GlnG
MARILLIDDDTDLADLLRESLEAAGHCVTYLEGAERGLDLLTEQLFGVVLLDNRMPGMSGIEFLAAMRDRDIRVPVILMTGWADSDTAIQAVKLGAFDYIEKPRDRGKLFAELVPLIDKALQIALPPPRVVTPGEAGADEAPRPLMLGNSRAWKEKVIGPIGRFAASPAPVLILGETGTGKELVARAVHTYSTRGNKPFVAMNCAALAENLQEDELFGHERGAFTGADKLRKGRFEYANGGTLFLDEIGDMPASLQAKLLRVLENQEITRIGGNEPIRVDVRLVSATRRDLDAAIRAGTFREDLFFRLNGVTIRLPSLRERGDDLLQLTHHFVKKAAEGTGRAPPTLHPDAWDKLRAHPWPGNIRELRNVLGRAVLMCRGPQIMPDDLELRPPQAACSDACEAEALAGLRRAVAWAWKTGRTHLWPMLQGLLERELLKHAAAELKGNKTEIAKRLDLSRGTIIQRLKDHGLE